MKKSFLSKLLIFFFLCSLIVPVTVSLQSCSNKPRYKTRNGGKRVQSGGGIGHSKKKKHYVRRR